MDHWLSQHGYQPGSTSINGKLVRDSGSWIPYISHQKFWFVLTSLPEDSDALTSEDRWAEERVLSQDTWRKELSYLDKALPSLGLSFFNGTLRALA